MHIELKYYKFKFLEKMVIQHDIRPWFVNRSWIQAISQQFAFLSFVSPFPQFVVLCLYMYLSILLQFFAYVFVCLPMCHTRTWGTHIVREGVKEYNMHIESKSYKLNSTYFMDNLKKKKLYCRSFIKLNDFQDKRKHLISISDTFQTRTETLIKLKKEFLP